MIITISPVICNQIQETICESSAEVLRMGKDIQPPAIQKLYNSLIDGGLSPKSVKNTHRCLHKALDFAVRVGCIAKNPTEACILQRITQKEITPLDTTDLTKLMKYLEGHEHAYHDSAELLQKRSEHEHHLCPSRLDQNQSGQHRSAA